jgi:hypothetical protein
VIWVFWHFSTSTEKVIMMITPFTVMSSKYNGVIVQGAVVGGMTDWSGGDLLRTGEKRRGFRRETAKRIVEFSAGAHIVEKMECMPL